MTKEEIYLRIVDIMDSHGLSVNNDLENDIDSLSFVSTIIEIEETFNLVIPDEYLLIKNFNCKRLINCIEAMVLCDDECK